MEKLQHFVHLFIDIENSPFFTAAWDHSVVKTIFLLSSIFLTLLNCVCSLYSNTIQEFPMYNHGGKFSLKTNDISSFSQPFIITSNIPINKEIPLLLTENTGSPKEIYGTEIQSVTIYRFFSSYNSPSFSISPRSDANFLEFSLFLRHPTAGKAIFMMHSVFLTCSIGCFAISLYVPNLQSTIVYNTFAMIFSFLRFDFFHFSHRVNIFFLALCWLLFVIFMVLQSNLLFSSQRQLRTFIISVAFFSSFLLILTHFSHIFILPSIIIWFFFPLISFYLFWIGKLILHPILLGIHFLFFNLISGVIYFSAIFRNNYFFSFDGMLLSESIDLSFIATFALFQLLFVMGEPFDSNAPDLSIGNVSQKNMIDKLLEDLGQDDSDIRSGLSFE